MKDWRRTATVLLLSLILASAISCNIFGGDRQDTSQQLVEVVRGDLVISVSGSGNLEVATDIKLAFGVAGRIEGIYVEEGDEVSAGEVLAKLETDALEMAVTQAKVARAQAEIAVAQAQAGITQAEAGVTQAEAGVTQAQVNLKNAEIALELAQKTYSVSDIRAAEADVDVAQRNLDEALWVFSKYDPGTIGYERYQEVVVQAEAGLKAAKDKLDAMLTGFDAKGVAAKRLQVEAARQSLELAGQSLEIARQSLELAGQSLRLAEQSLKATEQSLELAQKQLAEATLTAPFDGVVARVIAEEKDTVSPTTTIIYLIDPSRLELNVEVDEIDIIEVRPGQRAIIELDALPSRAIEGKVNFISLLPTVEAGVILYDVKISFDSIGVTGIRTGMSASADIIIRERNNVLLVPNQALKQDNQGNPAVEVMLKGQSERRAVVTGISDGFQTEIISGLEEGEVVIRR